MLHLCWSRAGSVPTIAPPRGDHDRSATEISKTRMTKRSLAILLALLVVARACLVLSLSDVFFYGEEMGKGAAAKAMLDHLGVEHYMIAYGYHEGGGFVVTHLKALAFLLVDECVLANKLVALFTTSVLLLVGCWFASEHFGRRAGWIFGLLFVLAPAAFQRCSLIDVGTHFEAMIFIVLILHFALRIAFADREWPLADERARKRRSLRDHIGLGLSAGFGLYFSLQSLPAIACGGLCVLVARRRAIASRATLAAVGAFVVGALPLVWMMSNVGMAALVVRGHDLGAGTSAADAWRGLFEPLRARGNALHWFEFAIYPLVIAIGIAWMWRDARSGAKACADRSAASSMQSAAECEARDPACARSKAIVVLGYLALYVALYVASGLAIGYYGHWFFFLRLSPVWLMGIVLIAAVSRVLLTSSSAVARTTYAAALGVLAISGAIDVVAVMREGRPSAMGANARTLLATKGYSYSEYLDKFVHHFDASEEDKIKVLLRYRDERELLWPSIEHSLFEHSDTRLDDILAISQRAFGAGWIESLKGLGPYFFRTSGYNLDAEFDAIAHAPAETQQALAEAIGRTGRGLKIDPPRIEQELHALVPPQWRSAFLRGTGWRIHQITRLHPEHADALIAHADESDQPAVRAGYDAAVAANRLE
jgi:hypothetical protein